MKIGDKLLKLGYLNKKQLTEALKVQSQEKILYNKDLQLGKILLDKKFLTLDELSEGLSLAIEEEANKEKTMATEIGENSKFTFDLKFIITMGTILVSAVATYFTITGQINELAGKDSPSRLEYNIVQNELASLQNAGNLDIITYKLEQYDETFKELKDLSSQLAPLATDLVYIKNELNKLKTQEIIIPEVDLSGIETKLDNLSNKIGIFEERLKKVESKGGGRF